MLQYLCDQGYPSIPCELVSGYLDFTPHAWNAILVKEGNSFARMVVNACHPADIREETDAEYYRRYFPLCQIQLPLQTESPYFRCSLSSTLPSHEAEKRNPDLLFHFKFGAVDAALRLESYRASVEEIQNFEKSFLAEVRMLWCFEKTQLYVEIYSHQLSHKLASPVDGENKLL
ncbi:uncharacterized protein A4U43_C08F19310 [Asparagus officinalis]|nr:uncharacterized protein A4U43_C08F19310 [Asparagus officinalis]